MNIWIIKDGISIVFKSYLDIPIKEHLISGLLTALNQFVFSEFNQPIESINMGGLTWVYDYDTDHGILFVAGDIKDIKIETLKSRLQYIKKIFIRKYIKDKVIEKWEGNLDIFKPFEETIEKLYINWQAAENIDTFADLFDFIRVFQQILDLIFKVIDHQIDPKKKEKIHVDFENYFENFKKRRDIEKIKEINKISYSRDSGFNIFDIVPSNCDSLILKRYLKNLFINVVNIIKEILGTDLALNYFNEYNIFNYFYQNLSLLKNLDLVDFMLQLFLSK